MDLNQFYASPLCRTGIHCGLCRGNSEAASEFRRRAVGSGDEFPCPYGFTAKTAGGSPVARARAISAVLSGTGESGGVDVRPRRDKHLRESMLRDRAFTQFLAVVSNLAGASKASFTSRRVRTIRNPHVGVRARPVHVQFLHNLSDLEVLAFVGAAHSISRRYPEVHVLVDNDIAEHPTARKCTHVSAVTMSDHRDPEQIVIDHTDMVTRLHQKGTQSVFAAFMRGLSEAFGIQAPPMAPMTWLSNGAEAEAAVVHADTEPLNTDMLMRAVGADGAIAEADVDPLQVSSYMAYVGTSPIHALIAAMCGRPHVLLTDTPNAYQFPGLVTTALKTVDPSDVYATLQLMSAMIQDVNQGAAKEEAEKRHRRSLEEVRTNRGAQLNRNNFTVLIDARAAEVGESIPARFADRCVVLLPEGSKRRTDVASVIFDENVTEALTPLLAGPWVFWFTPGTSHTRMQAALQELGRAYARHTNVGVVGAVRKHPPSRQHHEWAQRQPWWGNRNPFIGDEAGSLCVPELQTTCMLFGIGLLDDVLAAVGNPDTGGVYLAAKCLQLDVGIGITAFEGDVGGAEAQQEIADLLETYVAATTTAPNEPSMAAPPPDRRPRAASVSILVSSDADSKLRTNLISSTALPNVEIDDIPTDTDNLCAALKEKLERDNPEWVTVVPFDTEIRSDRWFRTIQAQVSKSRGELGLGAVLGRLPLTADMLQQVCRAPWFKGTLFFDMNKTTNTAEVYGLDGGLFIVAAKVLQPFLDWALQQANPDSALNMWLPTACLERGGKLLSLDTDASGVLVPTGQVDDLRSDDPGLSLEDISNAGYLFLSMTTVMSKFDDIAELVPALVGRKHYIDLAIKRANAAKQSLSDPKGCATCRKTKLSAQLAKEASRAADLLFSTVLEAPEEQRKALFEWLRTHINERIRIVYAQTGGVIYERSEDA